MSKTSYPAIELPTEDRMSTQMLDIYHLRPFWNQSALSWQLAYCGRDIVDTFCDDSPDNILAFPADLHIDYPDLIIELDGKRTRIFNKYPELDLVNEIAVNLLVGNTLSMREWRLFALSHSGVKVVVGTMEDKALQELIEAAIVRVARMWASRYQGWELFERLVSLYENQPILSSRSSESVKNQAYSTPIPLAYLASYLAGIDENSTVYEPTAGHGALLIAANPLNCCVNELDQHRCNELRKQGFVQITSFDAASKSPVFKPGWDKVIINPPFGRKSTTNGHETYYWGQFNTKQVDQAIIMRSLLSMKPDGQAALILAGQMGKEARRSDGYNSLSCRAFWKYLYENYNITRHISIAGKVYSRQGARFPIDLVIISGVGESKLSLPAVEVPKVFESYSQLRELFNDEQAQK